MRWWYELLELLLSEDTLRVLAHRYVERYNATVVSHSEEAAFTLLPHRALNIAPDDASPFVARRGDLVRVTLTRQRATIRVSERSDHT